MVPHIIDARSHALVLQSSGEHFLSRFLFRNNVQSMCIHSINLYESSYFISMLYYLYIRILLNTMMLSNLSVSLMCYNSCWLVVCEQAVGCASFSNESCKDCYVNESDRIK